MAPSFKNSTPPVGRTPWDLVHLLGSAGPRVLLYVIAISVTILIVIAGVLTFVHQSAEPGTEVSVFFGFIQYKKARLGEKPISAPPSSSIADTTGYLFPRNELLKENGKPLLILDKTLSIKRGWFGIELAGVNLPNIDLAARCRDGDAVYHQIKRDGNLRFEVPDACEPFFEIRYKSNYFSVEVWLGKSVSEYFVTASKIDAPTMVLKPFVDYRE